jgi:hypothetical protein
MITKYQPKPIEVLIWTGENQAELYAFVPAHLRNEEEDGLWIQTPFGDEKIEIGMPVIKKWNGEFFTSPRADFLEGYDEIKEESNE